MKFTVGIAMSPLEQLVPLAQTAEECGFANIGLPDSLFYMETAAADYPYTPDGSRMWNAETPWVDPLVAAAAMGAATSTIGFYTNVLKLGSRNPLLLARQVVQRGQMVQAGGSCWNSAAAAASAMCCCWVGTPIAPATLSQG